MMAMAAHNLVRMRTLEQIRLDGRMMRAKRPEMASDKAKMGLKWSGLAPESARIIQKRALASGAKLCPLGTSAAC